MLESAYLATATALWQKALHLCWRWQMPSKRWSQVTQSALSSVYETLLHHVVKPKRGPWTSCNLLGDYSQNHDLEVAARSSGPVEFGSEVALYTLVRTSNFIQSRVHWVYFKLIEKNQEPKLVPSLDNKLHLPLQWLFLFIVFFATIQERPTRVTLG